MLSNHVCMPARLTGVFGLYGHPYDGHGLHVERDEGGAGRGGGQGG